MSTYNIIVRKGTGRVSGNRRSIIGSNGNAQISDSGSRYYDIKAIPDSYAHYSSIRIIAYLNDFDQNGGSWSGRAWSVTVEQDGVDKGGLVNKTDYKPGVYSASVSNINPHKNFTLKIGLRGTPGAHSSGSTWATFDYIAIGLVYPVSDEETFIGANLQSTIAEICGLSPAGAGTVITPSIYATAATKGGLAATSHTVQKDNKCVKSDLVKILTALNTNDVVL